MPRALEPEPPRLGSSGGYLVMRAPFDVNVLIALLDAAHVHHAEATARLQVQAGQGWASCPITQIGCQYIMSHPAYPGAVPGAPQGAHGGAALRLSVSAWRAPSTFCSAARGTTRQQR